VRYAKDRLAGFSEVGDRGVEAKYNRETNRRIPTLLDAGPPKGCANWTGPLIAKGLGDVHVLYVNPRGLPCRSNRYCAPGPNVRHILPNRAFLQDRR
jgi:hypothetical protein